ncbi:Coiled-coil domain-containing protein 117 [Triplophysa tibetana]|uniref:Coiled-coil domain-containing protein 117 n=1 Tax=Triplophysa tibetana TaxID=1572043 RepID=A0A5A9P4X8_9TELE|nr:Coiled-coil domain-containing protein 117 [Triplophysa tibetana]
MTMQSHMSASSELEFILFSHHAHFSNPNLETISGPTKGSHHFTSGSMPNASCYTKRRKLMGEEGADVADHPSSKLSRGWSVDFTSPSSETNLVQQQTRAKDEQMGLPYTASSYPLPRVHHGGSGMEVEAAHRRLQEIEERITLEDDSEEELDVEPAQRRPVLVMSDSLREGLQRGIGDILPHTVAQSMNHSCMELVLWRPPEDPLTQRLKDSLQKQQRKQLSVNRQTPTPIPTVSTPPPEVQFTSTNEQTFSPLFSSPSAHSSGEEDMEL